ncbi:glycosyltransferase involved in cell wall biosynthesis [Catalinimonas alkaloidigena]|uniref:glycosyltransferase family 4 protein n=1 Tax=Catalinimonas alkaloidigena TaxID=1075417 RepID=UPI002405E12D|nr:glycosyltransferase family 4 protein [Catalinimonas alkaloidigena]MDF9798354.1 glycosyltransferase involved in cell wall biosynthesis [Catalinimonas alkaloidigena]
MKIAITADPVIPVPPKLYGGIERIIDMLIRGLLDKGHEVTLFAHPESSVSCNLIKYKGENPSKISDTLNNMKQVASLKRLNYDIIHSFGRLAYLTMLMPTSLPKVMSYQREPSIKMIRRAMRLSKKGSMHFTGCSGYIADQIKPYAPAYAIPNGVPIKQYTFQESITEDAPLVFLGRIEHIKGTHLAIEVAQKSGRKLIIAGNIPDDKKSKQYFDHQIKPHLNENIEYVGPVNDEQKNNLLGGAYAFLMPILWNEPFGIVMAEALACGTPIIGMDRGSVPEVVRQGINGFRCNTVEEMVNAVLQIQGLKRKEARLIAENKFSDKCIVDAYESLYFHLKNLKH